MEECVCVSVRENSLHPVVLLRCGEDPLVAHVHLAERPAPVALLVEERHGRHDDGADDDGLAVRDDGLLCHHVAHVLYIPSIKKGGKKVNKIDNLQRRGGEETTVRPAHLLCDGAMPGGQRFMENM